MIRILTTLFFASFCLVANSQTGFTEASDKLANQFVNSGAAMGVVDMNGDGLDDIIRLHSTTQLVIEHQTASGEFENLITGITTPNANWSLCIDDVDKNGMNDVFLGTSYFPHSIIFADDSGKVFTQSNLSGPSILPQGANFVDIDNDGDSDLFVCNDNGANFVYRNEGDQNFVYDTNMLNTNTAVMSDNSGNYASLWTDYDNDDDLDLYISKCRLGVTEITDPRRINMLWENDGNGNYTEVALERGLVPYAQSWATDFADIDNDGDLDVFMINHDTTNRLYENDGTGHYTDITDNAQFSPAIDNITVGIQTQFADFDNDGFVDLLMTSSQGSYKYFRNNGNKTFGVIFGAFQTLDLMQTMALGDLNNDGFIDVLAGFGEGYNTPTFIADKLFLNDGNANNWSKIRLRGTNSNINGVGARLEAHGPWGTQVREVRSGVSYGICSSLTSHFGIGSATAIDSLVIKWPSGYRQVITNPAINETLLITEEGCITPPPTFTEAIICEGETLLFGGESLTQSGNYSRDILLASGCDSTVMLNLIVNPSYNSTTGISVCAGDSYDFPDGTSQLITQDIDYTSFLTSVNSCDSLITTSINVLPNYSYSEMIDVCQGETYTWPDGTSSVILDSQSYTSILSSQFNCDSLIVTSVNVTEAPNEQVYGEICQGETYTFPDGSSAQINEDYIYETSFPTSQACDSVVSYIITSLPHYNTVEADQACIGGDYTFPDGTTFAGLTTSFSWTSYLIASTGCDSIVLINLEVIGDSTSTYDEFVEVCQGQTYTFPDGSSQVVDQSFSYMSALQSINGCDSLINTSINAKQSYQFTLTESICSGDDYTFFDGSTQINITEDLLHNSVFTTFDGCDSIIVTDLSVIQPQLDEESILICQGDNYIFPDGEIEINIQQDLTHESILTGANNCDSIVTTYVTASPSFNVDTDLAICSGESITIGGVDFDNINTDTTITFNNLTSIGCDSIYTYDINVENINTSISLNQATASADAIDVDYQWIDCNTNEEIPGATGQTFTPDVDGDYAVILEGFVCISQSECINIVGTSTEDTFFSASIDLFPNPVEDQLQISIDANSALVKGTIYDIHGKQVFSFETNTNATNLKVDFLPAGLYVTRLETEGKFALKKFVKI